MPMLHRFSFLRLCFLVWAPSSRQATADAWREGQWRPSPLARSRVVFLRLCGKGGREREKSNKARKKRKKRKKHSDIKSPRGVGEQRGKKNSGAFALSPLLAPHFFLPSRIAPRLGRRKKKVFCLSLKKEATMPYVSSPDDGTQIWYELVDELKEAESGGAGAGAEASPSASSPQGGGGSSSTSDDGAAAAAAKPTLSRRKRPRLVFIMGMGATSGCWGPQVDALAKSGVRAQALLLDNRGVGKSGSPRSKKSYSTTTMARDVLACMVSVAVSPCFGARFWARFWARFCSLWAACYAMLRYSRRGERTNVEKEANAALARG